MKPVFEANRDLLSYLGHRVQDVASAWKLYTRQGLVPDTNVFEELTAEIQVHGEQLAEQCRHLQADPSNGNLTLVQRYYATDIRKNIFSSLFQRSEALTSLAQHLASRVITHGSSEPTLGSVLNTHRFSGWQAVYDAAEALMADYLSTPSHSLEKCHYKGLVVFSYDYQSAAWPATSLTTFPVFAEYLRYLPMLVLLAHEAGHHRQRDCEALRKMRGDLGNWLATCRNAKFLSLTGPLSQEEQPRFLPEGALFRRTAGEIISDLYATMVAGPSYALILSRYILPMFVEAVDPTDFTLVETERNGKSTIESEHSWQFYFASFKLRLAIEMSRRAGFLEGNLYDGLIDHLDRIEGRLTQYAAAFGLPNNPILKSAFEELFGPNIWRSDGSPSASKDVLDAMKNAIRLLVGELADNYQDNLGLTGTFRQEMRGKYVEFQTCDMGSIFHETHPHDLDRLLTIWTSGNIRPRHLIGMLAPDAEGAETGVGRQHGVVIAMAHHPWIINRYMEVKVRR